MAAINSLLFILTTLSPMTEPPIRNSEWIATESSVSGLKPCPGRTFANVLRECPRHEHYEQCGGFCEKSCDNEPCPYNCCLEGCFCDDGFVRGPEGLCIPLNECSNAVQGREENRRCSGRNQHFTTCGSACPLGCSNYDETDRQCIALCVEGCFCKTGYVLGPQGNCILPSDCP